MQTIKFSHRYFKMPINIETKVTYLLGIQKIHYNNLSKGFIDFDTLYNDKEGNLFYYKLPKTDLLILTLFSDSDQSPRIWTTVRRWAPQKEEYYKNLVGQEVKILIEEIE
ncbi:hypothetical protein HYU06_01540 [Candidatus Woesearchaeota archaeon]|nr:hypothetical protein [Candidatus Woesearchaeota archaeon]